MNFQELSDLMTEYAELNSVEELKDCFIVVLYRLQARFADGGEPYSEQTDPETVDELILKIKRDYY